MNMSKYNTGKIPKAILELFLVNNFNNIRNSGYLYTTLGSSETCYCTFIYDNNNNDNNGLLSNN